MFISTIYSNITIKTSFIIVNINRSIITNIFYILLVLSCSIDTISLIILTIVSSLKFVFQKAVSISIVVLFFTPNNVLK